MAWKMIVRIVRLVHFLTLKEVGFGRQTALSYCYRGSCPLIENHILIEIEKWSEYSLPLRDNDLVNSSLFSTLKHPSAFLTLSRWFLSRSHFSEKTDTIRRELPHILSYSNVSRNEEGEDTKAFLMTDRVLFWAQWKELGKVWKINRLRCVKAPELKIYNVGYSRSLSFPWWLELSWCYLRGRGMIGSNDIIHQELHLGHCRGEMGRTVFVRWGWRQWSCQKLCGLWVRFRWITSSGVWGRVKDKAFSQQ